MDNKELNIIINEINELKTLIKNNDKLKYIINDLNNELIKINGLLNNSNAEINNNETEIKLLLNKYIENNNLINNNYNKLISKPINLLEIIINAVKSGEDLSADIDNISGAVDKIKSYENNRIDNINLENNEIINKLNNEIEKLNKEEDNINISDISTSLIEINENLKNIKLLIDKSNLPDVTDLNKEIENSNNKTLEITIDSLNDEDDDDIFEDEVNKEQEDDDFYNV